MRADGRVILWGSAHSLYTGKVRSYLIKKGLPYREIYPSHPDFNARVVPVVRHLVIPIVETPEGEIIQDSDAIIDRLEARHREPVMTPTGPVQRTVAMLLNAFASEYLLALAMHYRWTYRAEQERFLCAEFGRTFHTGPDRDERLRVAAGPMEYFAGFLPNLGVRPETVPAMEASYLELLDALDLHLQAHPYLLGGRPSIGDFGMMAPLFAHLGRDPVPASLMKTHAPNVYRWTERMNVASGPDGEFANRPEEYCADDSIPETLEPVLKLVFRDWGPGLAADAVRFNAWVADRPDVPAGTLVSASGERKVHPDVGAIEYDWHGVKVRRASAVHGLWLFAKVTEHARGLTRDARARLDALVSRTGGAEMMAIRVARPMKRENNVLVLA